MEISCVKGLLAMAQWPLWLCRRATLGEAACVVSPPAIPALGLPSSLGCWLMCAALDGAEHWAQLILQPGWGIWGLRGAL